MIKKRNKMLMENNTTKGKKTWTEHNPYASLHSFNTTKQANFIFFAKEPHAKWLF